MAKANWAVLSTSQDSGNATVNVSSNKAIGINAFVKICITK